MEDTTPEKRELVRDIIMSKSLEERVLMCAAMYDDAVELAKVEMPPGLPEGEQKAYVFKRLHGVYPVDLVNAQSDK